MRRTSQLCQYFYAGNSDTNQIWNARQTSAKNGKALITTEIVQKVRSETGRNPSKETNQCPPTDRIFARNKIRFNTVQCFNLKLERPVPF